MHESDEALVEIARREGPRGHAGWNALVFEEVVAGPAAALAASLRSSGDGGEGAFAGYLDLVREAIACGYLGRGTGPVSFLELCLLELLPERLASVPAQDRIAVLGAIWNDAEGLVREPAWMERYVFARARAEGVPELSAAGLEAFLVRVLEPVLTPAGASAWTGPFRVSVLDARALDEEFLPGTMRLAAPTVLSVRDRRRPVHLGVILQVGGRSQLIGPTADLGDWPEEHDLPSVELHDRVARINAGGGAQEVPLPHLRRAHGHVVTRSGFLVASAIDSQRLWIVEST